MNFARNRLLLRNEANLIGKEESLDQAEEKIQILMKEMKEMKTSSVEVVDQWKGVFIHGVCFASMSKTRNNQTMVPSERASEDTMTYQKKSTRCS